MQHPALTRGHGRKRIGSAIGANLFDGRLSCKLEFPVALSFEACRIEKDEVMLFGFEPKDLGGNVLDGVKKFTVAGKKEGSISASKLDADQGRRVGGGDRGSSADRRVSVGLHLAVAGKDVGLEVEISCIRQNFQEL